MKRRLAYAFFGYLASVLIAVAVVVFAIRASSLAPRDASMLYLIGLGITLPAALPGFLFTLFAARRGGWSGWLPYACAGTLNAALGWAIFDIVSQIFDRGPPHMPLAGMPLTLLLPCLLGGFAGGIAYWAVIRNSLRRRATSP